MNNEGFKMPPKYEGLISRYNQAAIEGTLTALLS